MKGVFITCEGGEGSGKTTQMAMLKEAFTRAKINGVFTREPGGNAGADAIRQLLLTGAGDKWHDVTETLLFQAARTEHVERVIRPALAKGEIVVCDRFLDSTLVYQGLAKGLGIDYIRALHQLTLGDFKPELTIYIDIDPALGLNRAASRKSDETRFESLDKEFHTRVREGFLQFARNEPQRFVTVDGAQTRQEVHETIVNHIRNNLGLKI